MEGYIRLAMLIMVPFMSGYILGWLWSYARTIDWLKGIAERGRTHIVRLDKKDESLDLFMISDEQLIKCVPHEVYCKLTAECRIEDL